MRSLHSTNNKEVILPNRRNLKLFACRFCSLQFGIGLALVLSQSVMAQPTYFADLRESLSAQQWEEAEKRADRELAASPANPEKSLLLLVRTLASLRSETSRSTSTLEMAEANLRFLVEQKHELVPYAHWLLASAIAQLPVDELRANKEFWLNKAIEHFRAVLQDPANLKLQTEATLGLGRMLVQAQRDREARPLLQRLERSLRRDPQHPQVLWALAQLDRRNSPARFCQWAIALWSKYPTFSEIQNWGLDLASNSFAEKPTGCQPTLAHKRTRIRNLQWFSRSEQAQKEIEALQGLEPFEKDRLRVAYLLHEGDPKGAVQLLAKHYQDRRNDFDYLNILAGAAARGGDLATAVGSYWRAYQLQSRTSAGRQALFQSAFLSYQFQDYDGATRRFQELVRVFPKSGLAKDARWHLAWLRYLRGDFQGAYGDLAELIQRLGRRDSHASFQRARYWQAMSQLRLGSVELARRIFQELADDPLYGFYSVASQQRLQSLPKSSASQPAFLGYSRFGSHLDSAEISSRSGELSTEAQSVSESSSGVSEPEESEETIRQVQLSEDESEIAKDTTAVEIPSTLESGVELGTWNQLKTPAAARAFERARALVIVGLDDWARWDLFEIERRTRSREDLRRLMREYLAIGNYQRASSIAQLEFAAERARLGIERGRSTWEFAFPQAFMPSVQKYSKQWGVPREFIWSIMRAESNYRREAISPVGAMGLMQIMPSTGLQVSKLMGESVFDPHQLLQPDIAIRFGSRYLQRLLQQFSSSIPLAAASYNAGPHRAKSWLFHFGQLDMDEFIEHIPFVETRNYVKKVISNVATYIKLYGGSEKILRGLDQPVAVRWTGSLPTRESWDPIESTVQ